MSARRDRDNILESRRLFGPPDVICYGINCFSSSGLEVILLFRIFDCTRARVQVPESMSLALERLRSDAEVA